MSPDPRLPLDWVSPLPPVRSGIADYATDMLPEMATRCDLRVLVPLGESPTGDLSDRYPTAALEAPEDPSRLRLYHLGNNLYHETIHAAALEVPGVVLLHDFVLHHLLLGLTVGRGDLDGYAGRLAADHGWIGRDAARAAAWNAIHESTLFALPAHRQFLRSQRGVVVHSRWAAERLLEEDPELAVEVVPMGVPLPPRIEPERGIRLREELGIPRAAPLLGSFGFQTRIKRTTSVVEALRRPGLETAHLLVVGQEDPYSDLDRRIREAGVGERVHRLGYVPFERMQESMAAVDLCLNLRYPTAGETSASLLRVLASGQPAVVSDFGPMQDLPEDVSAKVAPGEDEVEDLASVLRALLADPSRLAAMGDRARAWVASEHDPARAASILVGAAERLGAGRPPGPDRPTPPAISSRFAPRLRGAIRFDGLERLGPGERGPVTVRLENEGPVRWLAADRGAGGVVLQIAILRDGRDLRAGEPWIALPRDLAPGESLALVTRLRRPPGHAVAVARLHVSGSATQPSVVAETVLPRA